VVVVRGEAGPFVLVDGYKRVRALCRLHRDTVDAVLWALPELEALLLVQGLRTGEGDSVLEQGWWLRELHERFGLTASELARRFDKGPSWVSRRLGLVRELPEAVQELVRSGALVCCPRGDETPRALGRANLAQCLELAPALAAPGLSSRQIGTLCAAFVAGTDESRTLILTAPHLVLRAETEAQRPRDKNAAERVLSDIAAVAAIARRTRRVLAAQPGQAAMWWPRGEIRAAITAAEADTAALFTLVRKEMADVGREHADGDSEAS